MFTKRKAALVKAIKHEERQLKDSPSARQRLKSMRPLIQGGKSGSFKPISEDEYRELEEWEKKEDDHDKRVNYIISMEIELDALNCSTTLKGLLVQSTGVLGGIGLATRIWEIYERHRDAIGPAIRHVGDLVRHWASDEPDVGWDDVAKVYEHRIRIFRDDTSSWHDVTLGEVFGNEVYKDEVAFFRYLNELFQPEGEQAETGG
jgi:hypothetical protein